MTSSTVNDTHIDMLTRQIAAMEDRMIDPREFGRLEQEVKQLVHQMDAMQATLTQINTTLSEARGGWRVLMMVGGAGAAVGGLVSWALQHVRVGP